ncbi:putative pectinesterase/pectinesterase inhibitor 20 [Apium graveolens]|uniref:putative pectinesterase/pectinesterase inhibitor 20 n=1 Tax=Apium graveolens TaxID=4045 RepID=UPI003D79E063
MEIKHCSVSLLSVFLVLCLFTNSTTASVETTCNNTPFPKFCKPIIPESDNIHDHGRFSLQRSISLTSNFLSLVDRYLQSRDTLPHNTVLALENCQLLAKLNLDFFSKTLETIRLSDSIQDLKAFDMQTLLSAALTNQQTCFAELDALTSTSIPKDELLAPLSNGSKLYSVSLAIFKHGWVNNTRRGWKKPDVVVPQDDGKLRLYPGGNAVNVTQKVVVDPSGNGNFTTINDAVAAAPDNTDGSNGYFLINIVAGVYEEYVNIPVNKKYLMMIGAGINQTIITGNRSVSDGLSTFNTGTFIVVGEGFVGVNMTIRNTAGAKNFQAVALRSGADLSAFYRCSFEGYQDTLYAHSLRQFYRECDIYGTIDFILGNAAVVVQNCNIYPRLPIQGQFDPITAQGRTDINQNTGTSIQNCTITPAEDLATTKTYLGRPWKEYSRVVVMESFLDSLIDPAGWSIWDGDFALNTLYYGEYNNRGAGSDTSNRVTWPGYHVINATDAGNFTVSNFLGGDIWLPKTGVPYNGGLL